MWVVLFVYSPTPGGWVGKGLFLVLEAPLLSSSRRLLLILPSQVRCILELQSETSVLCAGQTSAFLQELRAFLSGANPLCSLKAPPGEENVQGDPAAGSSFSPERRRVARAGYYRRGILFTDLLCIPPLPKLTEFLKHNIFS